MTESESRSGVVLELAEEFLDRYRKGERPPLKEYIDRHPELAAEIKEVFPAMAMMENIAVADSSLEGDESEKKVVKPQEISFKQLGDYRIIREIGHGGMGVVYEAEQVSLGRHVALKVLPNQALADAKQKRRFEREAKAAAKLHHTNIVPVFGVGEHDGLPYYVMQFIQGLGLDAVLDELNNMKPGAAHTPTALPTAGEIRISRRDVSAANMARSLMTGGFHSGPAGHRAAEPMPQPVVDATVDQPAHAVPQRLAAGSPAPSSGRSVDCRPAAHSSTGSKSGSGRLADSFTVSSSSIILPGASGTGTKTASKKQSYWQSVANIGRQVADALEYAHKQGVLHRDVKPSNLLLDLRGTVWVTDFGLAKVAGPGAENLTHTGDILGTLRYMPPEAFEGKSDARSDVYSLGLTMYELLAMRPAFDEKDRNKLIKQVTTGEPAALDKVNRDTPRDLVTIIHKAIDREPNRRYATAEDLASDLQRFLDDEPILARRQTQFERYVRWARHNPGIAVLGGVLTAVLFLVSAASLIVASRMSTLANNEAQAAADERIARAEAEEAKNREANEKNAATNAKKDADASRKSAEEALKKAEENFTKARAAVNDYLTAVSEDERLKAPGLQGLRIQLLQSALQFYQQFLKERGNDPTLRRELAGVYYKVGEIYRDLGQAKAAAPAYAQAQRMYEALAAESPDDPDLQHGLALALKWTGGRTRAIAILEKLIHPEDPKYHADLGDLYNSEALAEQGKKVKGKIVNSPVDPVKQLEFLRKALMVRERLVRLRPDDADARIGIAGSLNNIAIRLKEDRNAEALAMIQRSVEQMEAAYRLRPTHLLTARYLTIGLNNVAKWGKLAGETEAALAAHRRRVEVMDRRARDNPTIAGFDADLAGGYTSLLLELRQASRWEEAARTAEAARVRLAETTEETSAFFQQVLTFHLTAHAVALAWAKADPDADVNTERDAVAVVNAMRQYALAGWRNGENWMRTDARTEALRQRADFKDLSIRMDELGQADAKARLTTATGEEKQTARQTILTTLEALAGPLPHARFVRRNLAQARQEWAQALLEAGQVEEARLAFDDALLARQQLVQESPSDEQLRADLAQSQSAAGDLFAAAGKLADAVKIWDKALATLDEGLKTNPNSLPYRAALAERLLQVAGQASKFGLWDVAAKHYSRAVELQPPTEPVAWNFMALVAAKIQDLTLLRTAANLAARGSENIGNNGLFKLRALTTMPGTPAAHVGAIRKLANEFQGSSHNDRWVQALAHLRAGQLDKTPQITEGLMPAEKGWPEWQILALIRHRLGQAEAAAEALRQADLLAERRMKDVVAGNQLVLPLYAWDEWLHNEVLRAEAHQSIHGKPLPASPYERLFRGRVFLALEQHDKAEAEFAAAVAIRPDDADVWLTRSRIFAKLGQNERMSADLLHAQLLKGNDPKTWIETGRMLAERGEHKQADIAYARASVLAKGELNRFLETGWWAVGPYPERLEMSCPPERNPDPSMPVAAAGEKRELKWQSVPVAPHDGSIDTGAIAGSRRNATYYFLAHVYADRDRTESLVLRNGTDARLWVNGRSVLEGMAPWKIASATDVLIPISLREGRNTLLIKSRHKDGVHNWCECMFLDSPVRRGYERARLGLWAEAADAFAEADGRGPLNEYQTRLRVHSLLALGRDVEANQVFAEMVQRRDQSGSLGVAETDFLPPNKTEDRQRRIVAWRKQVDANPKSTAGYHRLANACFRAGQFAEAETNLRKAMAHDQLYFHPLLACTLHHLGKTDEAKKTLAAMEDQHARLVKEALAANTHRVPQHWEEEVWYQATLREARTLILGKDPGPSADETALRAKARARLAALDKAEDAYARLVEIDAQEPRLWIDRGRRLGELQRWDEATKAFEQAVKLAPKNAQVWKERGRSHAELGKWDEAAADLVKAIELAPPPAAKPPAFPWQFDRWGIDNVLVQWDEIFDRVAKLRPKDSVIWARRAQHFAGLGRWAEAEAALLRFQDLEPGNHWGPYQVAPLLLQRGDVDGYRRIATAMVTRFGNRKNWSIGEKVVRTALLRPGEITDFAALGVILDEGAKDGATRAEGEAKTALIWIRIARAHVAYRSGDFAGAIHQVTAAGPPMDGPSAQGAEAQIVLAMARQQIGDPAAAREAFAKARTIMDRKVARPELGWLYENTEWHQWVRCRLLLREAESLIAKDQVAAATPATLSPREQAAQRDRKARADSLSTQAALAQISVDIGQKERAEAEFRAVLVERDKIAVEEPGNLDYQADLAAAHEHLGQFLVSDGRIEEGVKETQHAVKILEQFAAGNPKAARLQVKLAANLFSVSDFHWKAGRLLEGRQAWQRALESLKAARGAATKDLNAAKMVVELELVAGRAYADLGLWTEASDHFRRAFAADPVAGNVSDRFHHAALLVLTGDEAEYRRYCKSVYERNGSALQDRTSAKMMVLRPGALPEPKNVVALVQEARDATNDRWWTVLDLALAQFRADQVKAAFATLQAFETISKREWAFSWPSLALARHKAGKFDEAREWLRKSEDWHAGAWAKHLAGDSTGLPKDGDLTFWLYYLSLRQEAIATVAGQPAPADAWLHLHRGRVYFRLGLADQANAEFQTAMRVQPDDTRVLLARSRVYASLGKQAEAQADRARAIQLTEQNLTMRPGDRVAADALATLLIETHETKWTALKPLTVQSAGGATLTVQPDNSVLASGKNPDQDVYVIEAEIQDRVGAIRLEAIPDRTLPAGGSGRAPTWGNFILTDFRVMAGERTVAWSRAYADFNQDIQFGQKKDYSIARAIDADASTGWAIWPRVAEPHWAVFIPNQPITTADKARLTIRLAFHNDENRKYTLGRFRLSVTGEAEIVSQSGWFLAAATPHAKVGAAYLAVGDARSAADFLTKATAANPTPGPTDWLVLALAHAKLKDTNQAKTACAKAVELLKPTGVDVALRPLLREVAVTLGAIHAEVQKLIAVAAGELPPALNDAIQQDPDQAAGYRDRANWYGERGLWKEAIADLAEEFRLQPSTFAGMRLGILLLHTGDTDRYRTHCQAMLERWASTEKNGEADQTLKTVLFVPDFKADPRQLARLANIAVSGDQDVDWYDWYLLAKGLHDCRTGKYADALALCRESRRLAPTTKGSAEALTVLNLTIEAIALRGKGDVDEFRRTLDHARSLLRQHVPGIDGAWWHDWLVAHILFREAEGLNASKK